MKARRDEELEPATRNCLSTAKYANHAKGSGDYPQIAQISQIKTEEPA
jgi:hypothetical protein